MLIIVFSFFGDPRVFGMQIESSTIASKGVENPFGHADSGSNHRPLPKKPPIDDGEKSA